MGIEIEFCGIRMKNPTVLASGFLGVDAPTLKRVAESGAGAVTMKSIGPKPRAGWPNPTVAPWECGLINAVGLSTLGYKEMEEEWKELEGLKVPLIASIYAASAEEFADIAEFVAGKKPAAIEINISCPNTKAEGQVFGCSKDASAEAVSAVKGKIGSIPLIAKLTPQAPNIAEIAAACEAAGADAICAINTVQGMVIDIEARKPVLANRRGGLSGPAVRPVAVRCVYDIFEKVKIPIIGLGGIITGRDAIEMIMAGATAVGIGTAIYYRGIDAFELICGEMEEWMKENGVKDLEGIRGAAHV